MIFGQGTYLKICSLGILYLLTGSLFVVFTQSQDMNYVKTTIYPTGADNISVSGLTAREQALADTQRSISYFSGWALNVKTISTSDTLGRVISSNNYYDARGRSIIAAKPKILNGNLDYGAMTLDTYLASFSGSADSAFERRSYRADDENRLSSQMPYGSVFHANNRYQTYNYVYDSVWQALRTTVTDEDGISQHVYTDKFGRKIMQNTVMNSPSNDLVTIFKYDVYGNLLWSASPAGYTNRVAATSADSVEIPYGVYNDGGECTQPSTPSSNLYEDKMQYMALQANRYSDTGAETLSPDANDVQQTYRERMEAPINDPNNPILRWYKPAYTLFATVIISHRTDPGACDYTIDIQYRVNGKGCWNRIGSGTATVHLKPGENYIEVRRGKLAVSSQSCSTPRTVYMRLHSYSESIDPKYVTTYIYDNENRLIKKSSPDEGVIEYIYDYAGRLRFVQDENHRQNYTIENVRSYWTYYKYDAFGRMIEQGELVENKNALELKTIARAYHVTLDTIYKTVYDTVMFDTLICAGNNADNQGGKFGNVMSPSDIHSEVGGGGGECDTATMTRVYSSLAIDSIIFYEDTVYGHRSYPNLTSQKKETVINRYDTFGDSGSVWKIKIMADADTQTTLQGATIASPAKTRLTRSRIYDISTGQWTEELYVYDVLGRVAMRKQRIPELMANKKFQYWYDASGRVLKTAYQDGQTDSFYQWFRYDKMSRLDSAYSSRNNNLGGARLNAAYDYSNNNGGKIAKVTLDSLSIQTVDYAYTSRDWLKSINDENNLGTDRFAMTLYYYEAGPNPRYNGNIARMTWNTNGTKGGYDYTYDAANRLTDATFGISLSLQNQTLSGTYTNNTGDVVTMQDVTSGAGAVVTIQSRTDMTVKAGFNSGGATMTLKAGEPTAGSGSNLYSEKNITYDANGNILSLTRHMNSATGSAIAYVYDSNKPNRLNAVSGLVNASYAYDANGNMLRDGKNHFSYDYRNMPITDTIKSGTTVVNIIKYAYDAAGQRIKMLRYSSTGTTLLDNSRIYVLNSNGKLMAEYVKNGSTWRLDHYNIYGNDLLGKLDSLQKRYYYLTDHLGSVRVTVKDTAGVPVDSWSDYYPFGKESRSSSTSNEPKEQFTGKERDAETGLDYFGARYYNTDIARFTSLDPDRDKYPHWTPYSYAGNMPVHLVDVNGRGPGLAEAVSTGLGSLGLGALGRAIFPPLLMMDAVVALSWVGDQMNQSAAAYEASKGNITNIESATTSYIPTESATVDQTSVQIPTQLGDGSTVSWPTAIGSSTTTTPNGAGVEMPTTVQLEIIKSVGGKVEAKRLGEKVDVVTHLEVGSKNEVHLQIHGTGIKFPMDNSKPIRPQVEQAFKKPKSAVDKLTKNVEKAFKQRDQLQKKENQ